MRTYIPSEGTYHDGADNRTVVEWAEYPPDYTQELWDEAGPDCLRNHGIVVEPADAQRVAMEKARLPNNYGGVALIHQQRLEVYGEDRDVCVSHWEYVGDGEEVTSEPMDGPHLNVDYGYGPV